MTYSSILVIESREVDVERFQHAPQVPAGEKTYLIIDFILLLYYNRIDMNKVQLSLTNEEAAILEGYGSQFGYSLPKTLRFIISKAAEGFVKEGTIPVFEVSEKIEQAGLNALKEYRAGKTIAVSDSDEFFDNL